MLDPLSGPHVMAAFLCDRVLQEKDGVLSFIRVVDRFTRPRPTDQIQPQPIQVHLVIGFKGGGIVTGNYQIKIALYKPNSATPAVQMENRVFFEGGEDRGINIIIPFVVLADEEGVHWIDIKFIDQIATRVPFRIILADAPLAQRQALPEG